VKPVASEASLRYTTWVRENREKVAKATGGRIAYIHVPNTALQGVQEFSKGFYPQVDRQGIIVDERFNGGGFIPDFFVERLLRKTWTYWSNRDGEPFRTPSQSIDGPKCILANEYAGSGVIASRSTSASRAWARSSASARGAGWWASRTTCRSWMAAR
jgi:tricorn protease